MNIYIEIHFFVESLLLLLFIFSIEEGQELQDFCTSAFRMCSIVGYDIITIVLDIYSRI